MPFRPCFAPNPRRLDDGHEWVVYPFIAGSAYEGAAQQIEDAGALLGAIHAVDVPELAGLERHDYPVARTNEWIAGHAERAKAQMHAQTAVRFSALLEERTTQCEALPALPLAGGSFDFKAANLVFTPEPVLVDPDHAALLPRPYDLAIAALLFHCDAPQAPARLWTREEWRCFLASYESRIELAPVERAHWLAVLRLAWIDQGVWLLGNFPEGWADTRETQFLEDLATCDLERFALD